MHAKETGKEKPGVMKWDERGYETGRNTLDDAYTRSVSAIASMLSSFPEAGGLVVVAES